MKILKTPCLFSRNFSLFMCDEAIETKTVNMLFMLFLTPDKISEIYPFVLAGRNGACASH